MAEIDLLALLFPYGQRQIKVKAKATGYTDSDMSNAVTYYSRPHVQWKDRNTLRITNCRAASTNYEIYLEGVKVSDVAYNGVDGGTMDVDITALGLTENALNKMFVKGTGNGVEDNQSETLGFWYGDTVILGVSGLYQSDPALERTDDAIGLSWTMSNNVISSDFDNKFPYNVMHREVINDDVFVYIPEMYWRIGYDSSGILTDIAVAPCLITAGENQVIAHSDAFYYGAYGATYVNDQMRSVGSGARGGSKTIAQNRVLAKARGGNYRQLDLYHMRILEFLWLIEFATKDSDSVMRGYTSYSGACGATDTMTAPSAQTSSGGRMRWRYIEDFIGNGYEWVDGVFGTYIKHDESEYSEANVGDSKQGLNGCLSALKIDSKYPLHAYPGAAVSNGSYNTYFCDSIYFNSGYVYCRGRGGTYVSYGLFSWYYCGPGNTSASFGSRLLLIL